MSLMECPECRRSVSDRAAACPHCGYPINPEAGEPVLRELLRRRATMGLVTGAVFLVAGLAMPARGGLAVAALGAALLIIGWFRYQKYRE